MEAVRFYMLGQNVGHTPVFDGICARCGSLLYGYMNTTELGNKRNGLPVNADDSTTLVGENAQPPFLLRWPPEKLSQMAPAVFAFDQASGKVSLREEHQECPPWRVPAHGRTQATEKCWLYCESCEATLFDDSGPTHVPFRDQRSAATIDGFVRTALDPVVAQALPPRRKRPAAAAPRATRGETAAPLQQQPPQPGPGPPQSGDANEAVRQGFVNRPIMEA